MIESKAYLTISMQGENAMDVESQLIKLVESAKAGDKKAFSTLVERLSGVVSSIALAITKDVAHSEDVSQKVFIKAWHKLGELKSNASILPWIRQLTRYTAINHLRDQGAVSHKQVSSSQAELVLQQLVDSASELDNLLIKKQQSELLYHFLENLPDDSKEAVLLYYREGQSTEHVSALLGVSESTLRKRLERARTQLKSQMMANYGKLILATAPVGLSSLVLSLAVTSSPVAAATLGAATQSQASWLWKLMSIFGGAVAGGTMALLANDISAKRALKHFDDPEVVAKLHRARRLTNAWIVVSALLMVLAYQFSVGWLFPTLSYLFLLVGVTRFTVIMAVANKQRIIQQAQGDELAYKQLSKQNKFGMLGWGFGVIGGTAGLLWGFELSGRFAQWI
ncbi:RNA polymerase sigma factor [Pseudoalteromonas umbrosa]|uniref:RNA polymerase sigma factor n=1 Tax=Pseudoalteromonas umbrosa TaxID=3048489 RepID=UPI0024C3A19A|nr:RNA polymerase sigma factor [Pseudoalteromonas sp. B95]MDK1288868.1 RNA polymerase sigma factor [Pseudoalteromonas sp. B95]